MSDIRLFLDTIRNFLQENSQEAKNAIQRLQNLNQGLAASYASKSEELQKEFSEAKNAAVSNLKDEQKKISSNADLSEIEKENLHEKASLKCQIQIRSAQKVYDDKLQEYLSGEVKKISAAIKDSYASMRIDAGDLQEFASLLETQAQASASAGIVRALSGAIGKAESGVGVESKTAKALAEMQEKMTNSVGKFSSYALSLERMMLIDSDNADVRTALDNISGVKSEMQKKMNGINGQIEASLQESRNAEESLQNFFIQHKGSWDKLSESDKEVQQRLLNALSEQNAKQKQLHDTQKKTYAEIVKLASDALKKKENVIASLSDQADEIDKDIAGVEDELADGKKQYKVSKEELHRLEKALLGKRIATSMDTSEDEAWDVANAKNDTVKPMTGDEARKKSSEKWLKARVDEDKALGRIIKGYYSAKAGWQRKKGVAKLGGLVSGIGGSIASDIHGSVRKWKTSGGLGKFLVGSALDWTMTKVKKAIDYRGLTKLQNEASELKKNYLQLLQTNATANAVKRAKYEYNKKLLEISDLNMNAASLGRHFIGQRYSGIFGETDEAKEADSIRKEISKYESEEAKRKAEEKAEGKEQKPSLFQRLGLAGRNWTEKSKDLVSDEEKYGRGLANVNAALKPVKPVPKNEQAQAPVALAPGGVVRKIGPGVLARVGEAETEGVIPLRGKGASIVANALGSKIGGLVSRRLAPKFANLMEAVRMRPAAEGEGKQAKTSWQMEDEQRNAENQASMAKNLATLVRLVEDQNKRSKEKKPESLLSKILGFIGMLATAMIPKILGFLKMVWKGVGFAVKLLKPIGKLLAPLGKFLAPLAKLVASLGGKLLKSLGFLAKILASGLGGVAGRALESAKDMLGGNKPEIDGSNASKKDKGKGKDKDKGKADKGKGKDKGKPSSKAKPKTKPKAKPRMRGRGAAGLALSLAGGLGLDMLLGGGDDEDDKAAATSLALQGAQEATDLGVDAAGKEAPKSAAKEAAKDTAKTAAKDAGKTAAKDAAQSAAKTAAKDATQSAAKTAAQAAAKDAAQKTAQNALLKNGLKLGRGAAKGLGAGILVEMLREGVSIGTAKMLGLSEEQRLQAQEEADMAMAGAPGRNEMWEDPSDEEAEDMQLEAARKTRDRQFRKECREKGIHWKTNQDSWFKLSKDYRDLTDKEVEELDPEERKHFDKWLETSQGQEYKQERAARKFEAEKKAGNAHPQIPGLAAPEQRPQLSRAEQFKERHAALIAEAKAENRYEERPDGTAIIHPKKEAAEFARQMREAQIVQPLGGVAAPAMNVQQKPSANVQIMPASQERVQVLKPEPSATSAPTLPPPLVPSARSSANVQIMPAQGRAEASMPERDSDLKPVAAFIPMPVSPALTLPPPLVSQASSRPRPLPAARLEQVQPNDWVDAQAFSLGLGFERRKPNADAATEAKIQIAEKQQARSKFFREYAESHGLMRPDGYSLSGAHVQSANSEFEEFWKKYQQKLDDKEEEKKKSESKAKENTENESGGQKHSSAEDPKKKEQEEKAWIEKNGPLAVMNNIFKSVADWFTSKFSNFSIISFIREHNPFSIIMNGISSLFDWFNSFSLIDWLKRKFGFGDSKQPQQPLQPQQPQLTPRYWGEGGLVRASKSGTLGVVAEGGEDEAIMPLSKLARFVYESFKIGDALNPRSSALGEAPRLNSIVESLKGSFLAVSDDEDKAAKTEWSMELLKEIKEIGKNINLMTEMMKLIKVDGVTLGELVENKMLQFGGAREGLPGAAARAAQAAQGAMQPEAGSPGGMADPSSPSYGGGAGANVQPVDGGQAKIGADGIIDMDSMGSLAAKYESGNKSEATVDNGDKMGTSFGRYQIANPDTKRKFLAMMKRNGGEAAQIGAQLEAAGFVNSQGNNSQSAQLWKQLAAAGKIQQYENQFGREFYFGTAFNGIKSEKAKEMIRNSPTLQKALYSYSLQGQEGAHAGINRGFKEGMTEQDLLLLMYNDRLRRAEANKNNFVPRGKSGRPLIVGLRRRLGEGAESERTLALGMLKAEQQAKASGTFKHPAAAAQGQGGSPYTPEQQAEINANPMLQGTPPAGAGYVDIARKWAATDQGYSQPLRDKEGHFDCSSLVYRSTKAAGVPWKVKLGNFNTESMNPYSKDKNLDHGKAMRDAGFVWQEGLQGMKAGDILWHKGHTVIYSGDGNIIGAHGEKEYRKRGKMNESVSEKRLVDSERRKYRGYWRYVGDQAKAGGQMPAPQIPAPQPQGSRPGGKLQQTKPQIPMAQRPQQPAAQMPMVQRSPQPALQMPILQTPPPTRQFKLPGLAPQAQGTVQMPQTAHPLVQMPVIPRQPAVDGLPKAQTFTPPAAPTRQSGDPLRELAMPNTGGRELVPISDAGDSKHKGAYLSGSGGIWRKTKNLGNIKALAGQKAYTVRTKSGKEVKYRAFDTWSEGILEQRNLLIRNYFKKGQNTVASIIRKYAPPSENNTEEYINFVCKMNGWDRNQPINPADPNQLAMLQRAMIAKETSHRFKMDEIKGIYAAAGGDAGGSPSGQPAAQPAAGQPYAQPAMADGSGGMQPVPVQGAQPQIPGLNRGGLSNVYASMTADAMARGVKYKLGARNSRTGRVDCSGWTIEMQKQIMQGVQDPEAKARLGHVLAGGTAEGIISRGLQYQGGQSVSLDPSQIKEGTMIGIKARKGGWGSNRKMGIGHIVTTFRDPNTGRMMVSESTSRGSGGRSGVITTDYEQWYKQHAGRTMWGVDTGALIGGQFDAGNVKEQMAAGDAQQQQYGVGATPESGPQIQASQQGQVNEQAAAYYSQGGGGGTNVDASTNINGGAAGGGNGQPAVEMVLNKDPMGWIVLQGNAVH